MNVGGVPHTIYQIDYNIKEKGIYDIESVPLGGRECGDYISGGDSNEQTISSGKGTFYLWLKGDSDLLTKRSRVMRFINRTTGVVYSYEDGELVECF